LLPLKRPVWLFSCCRSGRDAGTRMSFNRDKFIAEGFGQRYAWLDLLNSEQRDGFGRVTEHLQDSSWIQVFLSHWNLGARLGGGGSIEGLKRLRAFFCRTAEIVASGKSLPKTDLHWINKGLHVPLHRRVWTRKDRSYGVELVPVHRDWGWQRAELLRSLAELLVDDRHSRLKICPNPGCRWVFFDRSHGNTRKWCSDLTCGNRDKVRRLRARRRQQKDSSMKGKSFSRRSQLNGHPKVRD
jgi:hypothetical protein